MDQTLIKVIPFADHLGLELLEAGKEKVVATMLVRPELCTTGGILHGGAMMAMADSIGAIGAYLNLGEGAKGTTTIESKTNFIGSAPAGSTVTAETTPVHSGKRTSVWHTKIFGEDDRVLALVTQTQLVL